MKSVLVVAPHADDETLGCGGTILKMNKQNFRIIWLLITSISVKNGYDHISSSRRKKEISVVMERYNFFATEELDFCPGTVGEIPRKVLVEQLSHKIDAFRPEIVFMPFWGDVHSDHRVVFEACQSALKPFRAPWVERVLCYETISETDQSLVSTFAPNSFVDISGQLEEQISIMEKYSTELGTFPFPRSVEAIKSLARFRGAQAGFQAAEAFLLLRERI